MASIKLKFRPSTVQGEPGAIFYRVIHNRIARQVTTDYRIYSEEWDDQNSSIIIQVNTSSRTEHLLKLHRPLMKTFNDSVVSFGRWNRKDVHTRLMR